MLSSTVMPYGVTLRVGRAVEVRDAHVERIAAERERDLVDHVLDREHALRPAEAAERGVGHRVRLAAEAVQRDVGQPVGVVGVEHRAVVDRSRQVGGEAAARREREVERRGCGPRRRSRRRTRTRTRGACRSSACRRRGRAAAWRRGRSCARASAATQANSDICVSLPPKPPPMRRHSTTTSCAASPSACATMCCTSPGCCVDV